MRYLNKQNKSLVDMYFIVDHLQSDDCTLQHSEDKYAKVSQNESAVIKWCEIILDDVA